MKPMFHKIWGLPLLLVLLAGGVLQTLGWWMLPPARTPQQATLLSRLHGVSYSPLRQGHNPVTGVMPTVAEIDEDLALLATRVSAVRTYGSAGVLQQIPAIAAKHGLAINAGAWLGTVPADNEREVAALINVARHHPNVTGLMVGNEAILRADLAPAAVTDFARRQQITVDEVIRRVEQVRQAVPHLPVSTAEPWHIWMKYPQLAEHCDYLAIHLLPYWEGVPIEQGIEQVRRTYRQVRERFPDKRIVVAEVGWPTGGEFFGGAVPSLWNQELFVREFVSMAATLDERQARSTEYYIMEAFDQHWKLEEGVVGKTWGLFGEDRQAKFRWDQPSYPGLGRGWQWSAALLLGTLLLLALPLVRPEVAWPGHLLLTLVVHTGISVLVYTASLLTMPWLTVAGKLSVAALLPLQGLMILILLIQTLEMAETLWRKRWLRVFPVHRSTPAPGRRTPRVSIHLACCNEPPAMMAQTLRALAGLRYPDYEVIVVDNNTADPQVWQPVEQLCAALGERFRFFHLPRWPGYKAGALNFALQQTDPRAEIVGVIDADYTVSPNWLDAVTPYFDDAQVGLVQSPQDNRAWRRDTFKEMINWEYAGFFFMGMAHRNEEDAIIQHGTMCLMRRGAMEALGGWATWCICEDSELGLRLMKAGYRTVYVNQVLGQGLVPDDFAAYKKQRSRWAYGAVQILRRHAREVFSVRPAAAGQSLTLAQRYHFLAGWLPWIGDSLHLLFTLLLLLGAALMIVFPRYFMMPAAALAAPVLIITPFNLLRSLWLYRGRVPCNWRQTMLACVAGLGLTYTIGVSCLYSMVSTRRPFGRTPKCQNQSALSRSLVMARDEAVLMGLLWAGLIGVWATRPHADNPQTMVWLTCMALQSLPYLAAVACAFISSMPALNRAAAGFGQYRRTVLARRAKALAASLPVPRPTPQPVPIATPMVLGVFLDIMNGGALAML